MIKPFGWWGDAWTEEFGHVSIDSLMTIADTDTTETILAALGERFPHVVSMPISKIPSTPRDVVRRKYRDWTSFVGGSAYFVFSNVADAVEFKLLTV